MTHQSLQFDRYTSAVIHCLQALHVITRFTSTVTHRLLQFVTHRSLHIASNISAVTHQPLISTDPQMHIDRCTSTVTLRPLHFGRYTSADTPLHIDRYNSTVMTLLHASTVTVTHRQLHIGRYISTIPKLQLHVDSCASTVVIHRQLVTLRPLHLECSISSFVHFDRYTSTVVHTDTNQALLISDHYTSPVTFRPLHVNRDKSTDPP